MEVCHEIYYSFVLFDRLVVRSAIDCRRTDDDSVSSKMCADAAECRIQCGKTCAKKQSVSLVPVPTPPPAMCQPHFNGPCPPGSPYPAAPVAKPMPVQVEVAVRPELCDKQNLAPVIYRDPGFFLPVISSAVSLTGAVMAAPFRLLETLIPVDAGPNCRPRVPPPGCLPPAPPPPVIGRCGPPPVRGTTCLRSRRSVRGSVAAKGGVPHMWAGHSADAGRTGRGASLRASESTRRNPDFSQPIVWKSLCW